MSAGPPGGRRDLRLRLPRGGAIAVAAQGHDMLFNEATEGGHGPGATHAEEARYWALSYTFLARRLGLGGGPGRAPCFESRLPGRKLRQEGP